MRPMLVLGLLACACGGKLTAAAGDVSAPGAVDFGRAFVGYPAHADLTLTNGSRAPRTVRLTLPAPFTTGATELNLQGGEQRRVPLTLTATAAGPLQAMLELDGDLQGEVPLTARVETPPACDGSGPCRAVRFDPQVGNCVSEAAPEGLACSDTCVEAGVCQQGVCVGEARDCDDGDACTTDACGADGCVHLDASAWCPAPADPCRAAVCDPVKGCGAADAPDGTACGPNDCTTARVCIGGSCVVRPAPDGSECAPRSACQGAGHCSLGQCVQPAPTPLTRLWTYPGTGSGWIGGPLAADDAGDVYFLVRAGSDCNYCKVPAQLPTCTVVSLDRSGAARWSRQYLSSCELLALDADSAQLYLSLAQSHQVAALDLGDGHEKWNADLYALLTPLFPTKPSSYAFAVEQAVLGPAAGPLFVKAGLGASETWVVGLSRATGGLLFSPGYTDAVGALAGDMGGVSFVTSATAGGSALHRLSAAGQSLLVTPLASGAPWQLELSMGGDAYLAGGSTPPAGRYALGSGALGVPTAGPMLGLTVGGPLDVWTTRGPLDSLPDLPLDSLDAYDWATGDLRASFTFTPAQQASDLFVTDRGTAVAVVQDNGGLIGATSLVEADDTGRLLSQCPVDFVQGGGLLLDGVFVASNGAGLTAWAVPGLRPSGVGWCASMGSGHRDGRAR